MQNGMATRYLLVQDSCLILSVRLILPIRSLRRPTIIIFTKMHKSLAGWSSKILTIFAILVLVEIEELSASLMEKVTFIECCVNDGMARF